MGKYTVKKGNDGKYKLVKKGDVKPLNVIRPVADMLSDRIKKEKHASS